MAAPCQSSSSGISSDGSSVPVTVLGPLPSTSDVYDGDIEMKLSNEDSDKMTHIHQPALQPSLTGSLTSAI